MSVSFKFVDHNTNEAIQLSLLDDKMCDHMGVPHGTDYNVILDGVVDVGLAVLFSCSKCEISEDDFNNWFNSLAKEKQDSLNPKYKELIEKFLFKDYTFHAWR